MTQTTRGQGKLSVVPPRRPGPGSRRTGALAGILKAALTQGVRTFLFESQRSSGSPSAFFSVSSFHLSTTEKENPYQKLCVSLKRRLHFCKPALQLLDKRVFWRGGQPGADRSPFKGLGSQTPILLLTFF